MSDSFLNNPDFDSRRFDPLQPPKFKSGEEFEKHQRVIKAALKNLAHLKPEEENDFQRLVRLSKAKYSEVVTIMNQLDAEVKAVGRDHDRKALILKCNQEILSRFHGYSQEDLLMFLTYLLTESIINEII
jgi:hypothetical protein